jgi:glucose-6-phosphate isomerase
MSISHAFARLEDEAAQIRGSSLRELFADDPGRVASLTFRLGDLTVDFSRERLDSAVLGALVELAEAADVTGKRDAMFAGEAINATENRAVLHMSLRAADSAAFSAEGDDVMSGIVTTRDQFLAFAEAVRSGSMAAPDGRPFTDVVNIGIGGSDLGPAMAVRALSPDADGPRLHFVSNVDGAHLADTLKPLDPARTLFIVASKTFTTLETMTNAHAARDWVAASGALQPGDHFAAVSTNIAAANDFGIASERIFGFWDWVGGRYSVWSSIGLPVAIAIGEEKFRRFLAGAAAMDDHFRTAPLAENLPVLLALVGIWRRNVMGWPTVALIPYDQRLERFAAYIQQLDMESNGKRVRLDGSPVDGATGPVIWGEPGTNAQHSFFQLIHQGTDIVPVDFILAREARDGTGDQHALLQANCLAQAQALAFGRTEEEALAVMLTDGVEASEAKRLAPHRSFPGNRPSTLILHDRLDPFALGRLIALFEHKVFVQGAIWGINSFDQWGVELGKQLAGALIPAIRDGDAPDDLDAATAASLAELRRR